MNLSLHSLSLPQMEYSNDIVDPSFLDEVKEVFQIFRYDLSDSEVNFVIEALQNFQHPSFERMTPLFKKAFRFVVETEDQTLIRRFFQTIFNPTTPMKDSSERKI